MIGQEHIHNALLKRANACQSTGSTPSHLAFEGPRGMGKTRLMQTTSAMFSLETIETAFKQGTQMDKAVNVLRNKWRRGSVWIVDELHNLSIPNQMALKKLVESSIYTTNTGDEIKIPGLIVFSAFTDRSMIDAELLERFIVFRLVPYTTDERLEILTQYAETVNISFPYEEAEMIAIMNESPRDIKKAVDAAVILQANGDKISSRTIFEIQGKDEDGLEQCDRIALLSIAEVLGSNVKATLEVLSDKLRLSHKATSSVLSRLSSMGLVKTAPSTGRSLTGQGWEKVDSIRDEMNTRFNQPT